MNRRQVSGVQYSRWSVSRETMTGWLGKFHVKHPREPARDYSWIERQLSLRDTLTGRCEHAKVWKPSAADATHNPSEMWAVCTDGTDEENIRQLNSSRYSRSNRDHPSDRAHLLAR